MKYKIYFVLQNANVTGAYEAGKPVYFEARRLSPNNEALLLEIAEFAYLAEDKETAHELLKDILWRNQNNQEAIKRLDDWKL